MKTKTCSLTLGLLLHFILVMPLAAQKQQQRRATGAEEFFIISSVNLAKKQLFLKRPTEVTDVMRVSEDTVCLDRQGIGFPCKNLRAGDTVFVASKRADGATSTATRIRIGPMTVEEVHRRYRGAR